MKLNTKTIIALFLIAVILPTAHSQFCSSSFHFNYSSYSCIFDYTYTDPNCTKFSFNKCYWTECVDSVTVDNDTYCFQYKTYANVEWNFCTKQCCDSSISYDVQYNSLGKCQEYLITQKNKNIIIFWSVFGVFIVIYVTCCICICKQFAATCNCSSCKQCLKNFCSCSWLRFNCFKSQQIVENPQSQQIVENPQSQQIVENPQSQQIVEYPQSQQIVNVNIPKDRQLAPTTQRLFLKPET